MKFNPLTGRLGNHRFHTMLVHFPSGLYPFSFAMDLLASTTGNTAYATTGLYSLAAAVGMSVLAMVYGFIDFLQISAKSKAWKTGGIHALLNVTWFVVFSSLLFYRIKHGDTAGGWTYLSIMGISTAGVFFSNYLGADLIMTHRVGIESMPEK